MHTELISISTTAAGAGGAAASPFTGDSLTVKNCNGSAFILSVWTQYQADGYLQLVTPTSHDTTRGWRQVVESGDIDALLPSGVAMEMQPQELISATIAGSAVAGDVDIACLLIHYPDLPGVTSRGITWDDLMRRAEVLTTIQATLTATAAGYTGAELITAESDLLRANRDYAVLGVTTSTPCAAVTLVGPDTGYQRVAVPGQATDADVGRDWFCSLARNFDLPLIPVVNSGNKASTYLGIVSNENVPAPQVAVTLALLR